MQPDMSVMKRWPVSPTGGLSEEGLLFYLGALKTLLPLLPVSESHSRPEVGSDSEDDDDGILSSHMQVTYLEGDCWRLVAHLERDRWRKLTWGERRVEVAHLGREAGGGSSPGERGRWR